MLGRARSANGGMSMANGLKPPIISTAVAAWRDAFAAMTAMPVTTAIAFVIVLALSALTVVFVPNLGAPESALTMQVLGLFTLVVQAFLLAPLAIAVHRYVILGEITRGYPLDFSTPRYLRFVGFAILVGLVMAIPNLIFAALPSGEDNLAVAAVGALAALILFIFIVIVLVRRVILFPAIAVDAPGASWSSARNDTKGSSWRVLFILVCTAIPPIVLSMPLYWVLLGSSGGSPSLGVRLLFSVLSTIIQVPTLCAFAAAASHLFQSLSRNFGGPTVQSPGPALAS